MTVKIKSRNQILDEIIRAAKKHPCGWKASFGTHNTTFSHDYYLFHPNLGVYLLKEYHKNPYSTKGIGAKIARHIDDDIENTLTEQSGDFGIIQGNIHKLFHNIQKGISPQKILNAAITGDDLGLRMPVRGQAHTSKHTFNHLQETLKQQQQKLQQRFDKLLADDGIYCSYS